MCFAIPLKVKRVLGTNALMENGRIVGLGDIKKLKAGDFLEVYADMAVRKLSKTQAREIRALIKANL